MADPVDKTVVVGDDSDKKVSYESHSKLLGEKKKTQAENEELKTKLADYEQAKLAADGKLQAANDNLKKTLAESKLKNETLAKTVTDKVLFQQFAREAEKLGCLDVKLAYSAIDLKDVDVTTDLELDTKKLQEKIAALSKDKGFLFKKSAQETKDLNLNVVNGLEANNLSDLTEAQLKALLAKAK
jgi:hypothetical protein